MEFIKSVGRTGQISLENKFALQMVLVDIDLKAKPFAVHVKYIKEEGNE
jgi:hypothetical protein